MDEDKRGCLHERIYNDLLGSIQRAEYKLGDRLPSEKELVLRYGVSRITSKKALDNLCENGYVARRPGKGTFLISDQGTASREEAASVPQPVTESKTVGLIMEKISAGFGSEILLGVEQALSKLGYNLMVKFTYSDAEKEKRCIEQMQAANVSGLIIMCVHNEIYNPLVLRLYTDNFPVVLIDRELHGLSIPFVGTDNRAAARELTNALLARGHSEVRFVTVGDSLNASTIQQRMEGFAGALAKKHKGVWGDDLLLTINRNSDEDDLENFDENREQICHYMLEHPDVTGFVAASYFVTKQIEYAAAYLDRKIDIAGFDRPPQCPSGTTPLYILQNQRKMGETAAVYIDKLIQKKSVPPRTTYIDFQCIKE